MDLINYIGKNVKIILTNKYYFVGVVLSADEEGLDLKDFKGHLVSLKKEAISSIQEVSNGY